MELLSTAIKFRDYITLVVVWQLHEGYWKILSIVRLNKAIALARESPTTRLVFPTGVFPDGVWTGIYKHRTTETNSHKVDALQERREKVLHLLYKSPGQTRDTLAPQLGVSVATAGQLLRHLEKSCDIYYRPHPLQNRTRVYYVGKPPTTGKSAALSTSKSVPQLRKEPPLKVYFC